MVHELKHSMLARQTADDLARQRFVLALKRELTGRIRPGNQLLFDARVRPALQRRLRSKAAVDREEIKRGLLAEPAYQTWAALTRCSQELMWATVTEPLMRDRERIEAEGRRLLENPKRLGGLDLPAGFEPPAAMREHHIHLQPQGYAYTRSADDVMAGALYEAGGNLYSMGQGMGGDDSKGFAAIRWIKANRPGFAPKRILDLGCSAGAGSVPYAQEFPDAEVHAIDIGAAMLRYASARAESLGARVFFHQMDCSATSFPDGHFDLVVSHNLFHEVSDETRNATFRETWRLLAPGGLALHQDVAIQNAKRTPFEQAERAYDVDYNDEPFWESYADADIVPELAAAGFPPGTAREIQLGKINGPGYWFAAVAEKPATQPAQP
ncbi:MAG: class I SAM-dependent methyltransferase [Gammaproteobacteria bacterium]|nr:class I SAM-dependent methyltransferase [Gammaproteobacteria bacterium]